MKRLFQRFCQVLVLFGAVPVPEIVIKIAYRSHFNIKMNILLFENTKRKIYFNRSNVSRHKIYNASSILLIRKKTTRPENG